MEKLNMQQYHDKAFEAKLHGFKMRAPIAAQEWDEADDKRLTDLANRRFEQMQKRHEVLQGSV
jgi:hypothetical protein